MSFTPLSEKEERISRKTLGVAANAFGIHKTQGNELPRSRAARYQKEFLLTPMQSIDESL